MVSTHDHRPAPERANAHGAGPDCRQAARVRSTRFGNRHRPYRPRRVPSRPSGRLYRRQPQPDPRPLGICGVSLRSPDTRDALAPQDCLYTVAVRMLRAIISASSDRSPKCWWRRRIRPRVLDRLTRPATRIVSLTVTEKGYCHDPATGALNREHPDILHDLPEPGAAPDRAPASWSKRCDRRRAAGPPPFTVLSCDNLPDNGRHRAASSASSPSLRDPALGHWIADDVAFPSPWSTASFRRRPTPTATPSRRPGLDRRRGRS